MKYPLNLWLCGFDGIHVRHSKSRLEGASNKHVVRPMHILVYMRERGAGGGGAYNPSWPSHP
jgi:hypothetical protein